VNEMLLAAIRLGDQIERYGSYAGYAAIVGLGVMSMLYFAQAREVKRLREWAGRSPERDAELAQRVQTDAQRRVVAQPAAAVPAPAPVPPALPLPAQPGAPLTPAAQADAARKAAAATVMQKFQQPGAGPPASPLVGPPGSLARPGQPLVPGVPAPGAPSSVAPAPMPGASTPGAPVPPDPATAGAVAAAHQAASAARSPALSNGAQGQAAHESAAARPPTPMPDLPPRTARAASAAPSSVDRGGSRGRVGLIAGGVTAVLAIGVVLMLVLTGGDDTPSAGNSATDGVPPPVSAPPASSAPKIDRKATQVAVLNGTTQNGLAGSVANKIEDGGFTILSRGNNSDQQIATTTVSFADGSEPAARLVAKIVDVPAGAVQPMDPDTQAAVAAEAKVVVIVGNNLGSTG